MAILARDVVNDGIAIEIATEAAHQTRPGRTLSVAESQLRQFGCSTGDAFISKCVAWRWLMLDRRSAWREIPKLFAKYRAFSVVLCDASL